MKKSGYVIFLLLLISILSNSLLISGEQSINSSDYSKKNISLSGFKNSTNKMLQKEIIVPDYLQFLTKVLFGLKNNENVNLSVLVILIASWIILFLFIHNMVGVFPFFEGGKAWALSITATCLISLSGAVKEFTIFLFQLTEGIQTAKDYIILRFLFSIIVIIMLYVAFSFLSSILKKKIKVSEAKELGREAGSKDAEYLKDLALTDNRKDK